MSLFKDLRPFREPVLRATAVRGTHWSCCKGTAVSGLWAQFFTKFPVSAGRLSSITSSGCSRTMVLAT
jgi:hypothetical protein